MLEKIVIGTPPKDGADLSEWEIAVVRNLIDANPHSESQSTYPLNIISTLL